MYVEFDSDFDHDNVEFPNDFDPETDNYFCWKVLQCK